MHKKYYSLPRFVPHYGNILKVNACFSSPFLLSSLLRCNLFFHSYPKHDIQVFLYIWSKICIQEDVGKMFPSHLKISGNTNTAYSCDLKKKKNYYIRHLINSQIMVKGRICTFLQRGKKKVIFHTWYLT